MDWFVRDLSHEEEQSVARFLQRLASAPLDVSPRLPDVEVLRIKAQLVRRWEADRKIQAPTDVLEPMQLLAAVAAAAVMLMWSLPSLLRLVPGIQFWP